MSSPRSSPNVFFLCMVALSLVAPAVHAAVVAKKIPASSIFYNPKKTALYYYPTTEFALAACGPRDDDFRFSVALDSKEKAYVVKYNYVPFDTDQKAQFQNLRTIKLNLKTGALSFTSYGASISVDLKTYLKTDIIQRSSETQGGNTKSIFGQDLYAYDATINTISPKLVDLDGLVVAALKLLSRSAKFFGKSEVRYPCREKQTTPGHPTLKNLAAYLTTLSSLPTAKWA